MPKHIDSVLYITELPRGRADESVDHWHKELGLTVDRDRALYCLKGYGAWDDDERANMSDDDIAKKILWLACGDFNEFITYAERAGVDPFGERADEFDPPAGSDIFVLG